MKYFRVRRKRNGFRRRERAHDVIGSYLTVRFSNRHHALTFLIFDVTAADADDRAGNRNSGSALGIFHRFTHRLDCFFDVRHHPASNSKRKSLAHSHHARFFFLVKFLQYHDSDIGRSDVKADDGISLTHEILYGLRKTLRIIDDIRINGN